MTFRNPDTLHKPLAAYSHQAEVGSNAKWLVMSAQIGMSKDGFVPDDALEQIEIALDNIMLNLRAAGMESKHIAKLVFYFVGSHDVEKRRNLVSDKLDGHQPCMTVIYVAGLARPALKVEIDAWACM